MNDDRIIKLYFDRSEDAITETDKKYGGACRSVAYNILGSHEDSEECTNDTYMKVWDAIPPQKPRSLKAYLSKIIRNLALDRYEKNHAKKRGSGKTDAVFEEIEDFLPASGDDIADSLALRDAINRFIIELEKEDRIIFVQRYWYFCQVKDIAMMRGLSVSNVKMTLKRTRDKLREYLQKEGSGI